ncbi:MAG: ankyrin repeat domain-containing protein [Treponemataceae bacterium]
MKLFTKNKVLFVIIFACIFFACNSTPKEEKPAPEVKPTKKELSIHELIRSGNKEIARESFQSRTDINLPDKEGNTPLHTAASIDDIELCDYLLSVGAAINTKNKAGETAVFFAAKNKAFAAMNFLLEKKADAFIANAEEKTLFDYAATQDEAFLESFISQEVGALKNPQGEVIVHYFVKAKNLPAIDISIQKKIPLSVLDKSQRSPLMLAYEDANDIASIKIAGNLIMGGAEPQRKDFAYFESAVRSRNINMRFEKATTPLHTAVQKSHSGVVKYLIERNVQIDPKDFAGSTPLHIAVQNGNLTIIQDLLDAKADTNASDLKGRTPLFFIYPEESRTKTYELLLQGGSNPNVKDIEGETPLHFATRNLIDVSALTMLIDAGADFNERNIRGETPLALAVEKNLVNHAAYFVEKGSDIHNEDIVGFTPILGAYSTTFEMVKAVITKTNITSRNLLGNTPLHIAALQGVSKTILDYLYSCNAVIDARNVYGNTPLYMAVQNNHKDIGLSLLAKGADIFHNNSKNYSPLRLAFERGEDTSDWMINSTVIKARDNIGNSALHHAANWQFNDAVSLLIERKITVDLKNSNGETALFFATKVNNPSIIQILLDGKADKNARDLLGNTPLHISAVYLAEAAAKTLLENGANIDAQNLVGKTPLSEAARNGIKPMISLFLENGANVNAVDSNGKTALMDAVENRMHDVVIMLFRYGADGALQDTYGRSVYHEAVAAKDIKLIEIIKEKNINPLAHDTYGNSPLSLAMQTKDARIIDVVLPTDSSATDTNGNTPIHIAINEDVDTIILKQIVDRRFPLNRRNSAGITPLLLTIQKNLGDQAVVLLNAGADPFIADNSGNSAVSLAMTNKFPVLFDIVRTNLTKTDSVGETILHYAARYADKETVLQLLSMGFSRDTKNISGEVPEDVARRWMRVDIAEILKKTAF